MSGFEGFSEFTVSSVMARDWRVMWKQPAVFVGFALLSYVVYFVITSAMGKLLDSFSQSIGPDDFPFSITNVGKLLVHHLTRIQDKLFLYISSMLLQTAAASAVFQLFTQGRTSMREAFRCSPPKVLTIFAASLAYGLVICCVIPLSLLTTFYFGLFLMFGGAGVAFSCGILAAAALVLTVSLARNWSVFAPACAIEGLGPVGCLRRSSELTKGCRDKILSILVLLCVIIFIVDRVNSAILEVTFKIFGFGTAGRFVLAAVWLLPLAYMNALLPIIYFSLRAAKEKNGGLEQA